MVHKQRIELSTEPDGIYDLSPQLREFVSKIHAKDGVAIIFATGSTCGITTIEFETGLMRDFPEMMAKIAPRGNYHHDAAWGDGNGHAHLRSSLLGTSLAIPIIDGELATGTWQQVVFCEFDNRPRRRKVLFMFLGESGG